MKFFVTRNPIVQLKFNFDDSYERYSLLNFGTFLLRKQINKKTGRSPIWWEGPKRQVRLVPTQVMSYGLTEPANLTRQILYIFRKFFPSQLSMFEIRATNHNPLIHI
jgi:hypothetical protein